MDHVRKFSISIIFAIKLFYKSEIFPFIFYQIKEQTIRVNEILYFNKNIWDDMCDIDIWSLLLKHYLKKLVQNIFWKLLELEITIQYDTRLQFYFYVLNLLIHLALSFYQVDIFLFAKLYVTLNRTILLHINRAKIVDGNLKIYCEWVKIRCILKSCI